MHIKEIVGVCFLLNKFSADGELLQSACGGDDAVLRRSLRPTVTKRRHLLAEICNKGFQHPNRKISKYKTSLYFLKINSYGLLSI